MQLVKSAASLVLACGLAASPSALAAHKRHVVHHTPHHSAHHHITHHVAHHSVRHATHHATRHATTRTVAAHITARPEAEPKNLATTIPPIPMKDGHLYVPPPLRGSHEVLVRQNRRNDAEELSRIQNRSQLLAMRQAGYLVDIPDSHGLVVNANMPDARQCARPWTVQFLKNLAHAHYVRFHRPLRLTSATRTAAYQRRLMRVNANAAPVRGITASPHLSGAAVDISKKGLSLSEIAWMRAYLLPLEEDDKIDVEEEFYQACFHINVYESYVPRTRKTHRNSTTLLATGVR